jgi:hypothetical protein
MAKRAHENGVELVERADPPTHEQDPILNLTEVARQLGKHPSTIKDWCVQGLLIPVKMPSGLYGVRKSEVNKFLGGSALQKQVN